MATLLDEIAFRVDLAPEKVKEVLNDANAVAYEFELNMQQLLDDALHWDMSGK